MKTFSYFTLIFIFGGLIFVEVPDYTKPSNFVVNIDSKDIIQEKKEFEYNYNRIQKQQEEISKILDSIK